MMSSLAGNANAVAEDDVQVLAPASRPSTWRVTWSMSFALYPMKSLTFASGRTTV